MAKTKKNTNKIKSTPKKKNTSTKKKTGKKAINKKVSTNKTTIKKTEPKKIEPKKIEKTAIVVPEIIQEQKPIKKNNIINNLKEYLRKFKKNRSNAKKIAMIKKSNFQKSLKKNLRKIKMYGITTVIPLKYIVTVITTLIIIIIAIIGVSSLFNKKNTINLALIPNKIDQITTVKFDIDDSNDIVTSSKAYAGLKDYYEYDFEKVFGLDKSYIDDYVIKYNKTNGEVFIVLKATDGNQEKVKAIFDDFLSKNKVTNYLYKEYQGYLIYIKSDSTDNDAIVLSKIMQSSIRVFTILQELKAEDIDNTFGIKESYYEEALVKTSMLRSDTCQYLIIKPKNNNAKVKIKSAMDDYYAGLEVKWQSKNQNNYDLVMNRYFEEYDGYLIYLISNDNNLVMDLIKG